MGDLGHGGHARTAYAHEVDFFSLGHREAILTLDPGLFVDIAAMADLENDQNIVFEIEDYPVVADAEAV